jgi:pre-mRNA-splicing factor ATP-dependent RNA helicase DHX38/PRP16
MERDKQHTFRLNKAKENSDSRTSRLGLDKLADEKRAQALLDSNEPRKRRRLEDDRSGDSGFKGEMERYIINPAVPNVIPPVPSVPAKRPNHARHRGEETPSHTGGVSDIAKARLEEYRKQRERNRGVSEFPSNFSLTHVLEGIAITEERSQGGPKGLGDFQRRLNRDRDLVPRKRNQLPDWDRSPRSRSGQEGEMAPSVRVPNVGWDATPRSQARSDKMSGWGAAQNRGWDSTPRTRRGDSPDSPIDGSAFLDVREWEEEQLRLDRDWYMSSEGGGGAGDEGSSAFAMFEELDRQREQQLADKRVVCFPLIVLPPYNLISNLEKSFSQASSVCKFTSIRSIRVALSVNFPW